MVDPHRAESGHYIGTLYITNPTSILKSCLLRDPCVNYNDGYQNADNIPGYLPLSTYENHEKTMDIT